VPPVLLSLTEHKQFASIVTNDPVRDASLQAIIDETTDSILRYCNNGNILQSTYTQILPLPITPSLLLPFAPVIYAPSATPTPIDLQIYINVCANGDPAQFTSETLTTPYSDWILDTYSDITTSESGIVKFTNGTWFFSRERPIYSLGVKITPTPGAVKVVYTAGYTTVPSAIKGAINLITRKIYNARKLGFPVVSESLAGYSYSGQQSATANGVLQGDPTIRQMLAPFCRPQIGGYS